MWLGLVEIPNDNVRAGNALPWLNLIGFDRFGPENFELFGHVIADGIQLFVPVPAGDGPMRLILPVIEVLQADRKLQAEIH